MSFHTLFSTLVKSPIFMKLKMFPKWVSLLGIFSSIIYLMAQLDLFATVIPGFPVLDWAGLVGSSLWLLWLIIIGWQYILLAGISNKK